MKEERPHNKVLPKAGLNGFDWTFVQGSTFVLRLNFCAKNPRLRQYPKRYSQFNATIHQTFTFTFFRPASLRTRWFYREVTCLGLLDGWR
jgi:hypothetical protein